ncbi:MAG: acyl-CoA dehydrogenase family protein [Sphingomonadales bacterium]|nr:acyl-CoA dehydrogenase family protein [Sphingomonadales bacterium]
MPELTDQSPEVVKRAAELVPALRERAERVDNERRLSEETIQDMIRAGLFRIWVPKRYGGYQASVETHLEMIRTLGLGCASTAWTMAMMTTTTWMACQLPERAQDEIFGADPDARFVGLFTPTAQPAVRTDGGYIINGSRPWATGCLHATWAEIMVPLVDDHGEIINQLWTFVPMSDVQIEDTWDTMGLRGTGNTLVVRICSSPSTARYR